MTEEQPAPRVRGFHRFMFRWTPGIIIAEPFEVFLMVYGCVIGASVLNAAFLGPQGMPLYAVLGHVWILIWAALFFIGSVLMAVGMVHASKTVAIRPRPIEVSGLVTVGAALLLYGVAAPLRLPHHQVTQLISLLLNQVIIWAWIGAIAIRVTVITSPMFLLSVNRLNRVRITKEAIRDGIL